MLLVSSALFLERLERVADFAGAPPAKFVDDRRSQLAAWFAPACDQESTPYKLVALSEHQARFEAPQFSALAPFSRHGAICFCRYEGFGGEHPVPAALRVPNSAESPHAPNPIIRAQRARDIPSRLDDSDFFVYDERIELADGILDDQPDTLHEMRLFLGFIMARARSLAFASDLSERIYNLWLPPALLTQGNANGGGEAVPSSTLALFPFVTLTRRPASQGWRHTFTTSMVIVPTSIDAEHGRRTTSRELASIVSCLDGPSTNPQGDGQVEYQLVDESLSVYTSRLARLAPDEIAWDSRGPTTIRRCLEQVLFTAGRRQCPHYPSRELADATLQSLRMASCWLVGLDSSQLRRAVGQSAVTRSGAWWPNTADAPQAVLDLFDELSRGGFRPTDAHRVDQISAGQRSWMAWAPPGTTRLVSLHANEADRFPQTTRLNLFGWLSHMIIGAVTSREIMLELGLEVPLVHQSVAERAAIRRRLIVELEEMFDLGIAEVMYRRFYRRFRRLIGLDEMYESVRDRAGLLERYDDAIDRAESAERQSREDSRTHRHAVAAALLAAAIIFLTLMLAVGFDRAALTDIATPWRTWGPIVLAFVMIVGAVLYAWGIHPRAKASAKPANGPPGSSVTVEGRRFMAGETVRLLYETRAVPDSRLRGAFRPDERNGSAPGIANISEGRPLIVADAVVGRENGTRSVLHRRPDRDFRVDFNIPAGRGAGKRGKHRIIAEGVTSGTTAKMVFELTASPDGNPEPPNQAT